MTGHGLERAIKNEFSGDIMDGLIAILQCTTNKAEFFASRLHKSMAGIGTNDTQLIRLIVTRCEIDLNDIKVAFERLYGKSLRSWIKVSSQKKKKKNIQFENSLNLTLLFDFFFSCRATHLGIINTLFMFSLANNVHHKFKQFDFTQNFMLTSYFFFYSISIF